MTHLTNASGNVVEKYSYDVFGKPTIRNARGKAISTSAVGNRFLFTGRELIGQIGLYDYRNRFYSADLGRFLQPDPIGFDAGDINLYRYVGNNPINEIDPFGLSGWFNIYTDSSGTQADAIEPTGTHSWISFQDDSKGVYTTYGTFPVKGLQENKEIGRFFTESRTTWLNDVEEKALMDYLKAEREAGDKAWNYLKNCSDFAAGAWQKATGESLDPYALPKAKGGRATFPTPKRLGGSIRKANDGMSGGWLAPSPRTLP